MRNLIVLLLGRRQTRGRSMTPSSTPRPERWHGWIRIGSLATVLVSLVLLVQILPLDRLVSVLKSQVDQPGGWGTPVFIAAYVAATLLFVPGSALTIGAGAVFGLMVGTIVVSCASTISAALAFLIGRYLARAAVSRWASSSPRFAAIDRAIGTGGWKIIALMRLSPAVPFSVGNYLFGITCIRFWPYVLSSWMAMLPGTFMYVYLGHAGRAGLSLAVSDGGSSRTPGQWAMLAVGLTATVAVTIYVTRLAREAIRTGETDSTGPIEPVAPETPADPPRAGVLATTSMVAFALVLAGCTTYARAHRPWITGLLGPPVVQLSESYSDRPDGTKFDHSGFDLLLKKHVGVTGLVDYPGLKKDAATLDAYLAALSKAPLKEMGRGERLALLINAYNAFTLRLILDNYPVKSIKTIPDKQRWEARRWNVAGSTWSLNQIEHEEIRPHFREPRIHFALVCAAMGCPPLRNEAYAADSLEKQLEAQAHYVHAHERWFMFDSGNNLLRLTSLYDWYGSDFGQVAGSFLEFAARYSSSLKQALDAGRKPKVEFMDYDWSLNAKDLP